MTNPGIDRTELALKALVPPDGYKFVTSGSVKDKDLVFSLNGWRNPSRLNVNAKVLIVVRPI